MRNVVTYIIGCFFCSCAAFAQETGALPLDQQFSALVEEIEGWKKEMTQSVASRTSIETLLRQGVVFQRSYNAETDSIVKGDLLDEYVKQRNAAMKKLPVTVFMSYGRDSASSYPFVLTFEKDDLEVDVKRPLLLQRKASSTSLLGGADTTQAKRRMLFSYKESQRLANLLSRLIAKAKAKEAMNVSLRDFVASVQLLETEAAIFLQFKTPTGTVSSEMHRLTEFDAKLLIARINAVLAASPPPADYKEPDDLDPATAVFTSPVDESSKGDAPSSAGAISASALSFDVSKIRSTQGQTYGYANQRVLQQFDYRVSFRWGGEQPLPVQVIMYLVMPVNNKLAIVGRSVKETTLEPRRNQEMPVTAEQKIPGSTAGTVIVQCFSGGRLLKNYSSNAQHKKYAEMADIESQLPPLYQNPQYVYPIGR